MKPTLWWYLLLGIALAACDSGDGTSSAASTGQGAGNGSGGSGGASSGGASSGGASSGGASSGGASSGGASSVGGNAQGGSGGCALLSDEFDDASTLGCFSQRHLVEATDAQFDLLDVDATVPGHLTIEPTGSGWYADEVGPFVYKEIVGNFVVEVQAAALHDSNPSEPASDPYHSAGLLVRDPASVPGAQSWLMYNVGYQDQFTGTEGKTTAMSISILELLPGSHSGRLRICRLGDEFHMLRWLEGDSGWTLEHSFTRADLPATLQAGMIINAWPPRPGAPRDLQARFDYIHFADATSMGDCSGALSPR